MTAGPYAPTLDHLPEPELVRQRLAAQLPIIEELLGSLYGNHADFPDLVESIVGAALAAVAQRPDELRELDRTREADPLWFRDHRMVGAMCYVDRFSTDLAGLRMRIPYLEQLGVTYLHLMPLYPTPEAGSDGGYAVTTYDEVDSRLGSMADLEELAGDLRAAGISLALDLVFNHTAHDHRWARRAVEGDAEAGDFYIFLSDRADADAYDAHLREVFPEQRRGNFTWVEEAESWVWTTFHSFQWDLNYRNPRVFEAMLAELLKLANHGAEVIRLDAVPFIWKELGTNCENRPEVHTIIRALNALVRVAAPAVILKSEAIVHPDDVVSYLGSGDYQGRECQIAYNPLLMVEQWEALATGYTGLLALSMERRFTPPAGTAWVNYVRSHDDIGWGFADEDAIDLGIDPFFHRRFLNDFYTGEFGGSFGLGMPFEFNAHTQDMRISGTTASLAGLERAVANRDAAEIESSIRRICLLYAVAYAHGGLPLLYLGDEIGMLNDYAFGLEPAHAEDSRWVHRPRFDWERAQLRRQPESIPGRLFAHIVLLGKLRKETPAFGAGAGTTVLEPGNPHVYALAKHPAQGDDVIVLANYRGDQQVVDSAVLANESYHDLLAGDTMSAGDAVRLGGYEVRFLVAT